jgi:hypothetical protein
MNNYTAIGFDGYLFQSQSAVGVKSIEMAQILQTAMIDQQPNDLPLIYDTYTQYLDGNKNTIKQNRASLAMAKHNTYLQNSNSLNNLNIQQGAQSANNTLSNTARKASTSVSNQVAIGTTNNNNATNSKLTNMGNEASMAQAGLSTLGGIAQGGSAEGMAGAAVSGALNMGSTWIGNQLNTFNTNTNNTNALNNAKLGVSGANAQAGIANSLASSTLANTQGATKQMAINSVDTSNKIASNNYEMGMASINASLRDIRNQTDNLAQQGLNTEFDWGNNNNMNMIAIRGIDESLFRRAEFYFKQFGYTDGMVRNLNTFIRSRTRFNYVKTQNAVILGSFSIRWQNILQMIFDNGITFWHNPSYLYDWTTDNPETSLIN